MSIEVDREQERMFDVFSGVIPEVNVEKEADKSLDFSALANPTKVDEEPNPVPHLQEPPPVVNFSSSEPMRQEETFGGHDSFFAPSVPQMSEDEIRRRKSHVLYEYESKNRDFRYSTRAFTMNSDLADIENELAYVNSKRKKEESLDFWRKGLLFMTEGAVFVNNQFDPFKAGDMSDWSRSMHYAIMNERSYDDLLDELIEKYKHLPSLPVEVRLALMVGGSFGLAVVNKQRDRRKLEEIRQRQSTGPAMYPGSGGFAKPPLSNQPPPFSKQTGASPPTWSNTPNLRGPSLSAEEIQQLVSQVAIPSENGSQASEGRAPSVAGSKAPLEEENVLFTSKEEEERPSEPVPEIIEVTANNKRSSRGRPTGTGKRGRPRKNAGITLELA